MHVWEVKSVIMPQTDQIVFQSENIDLMNVLGTGPRSVTVQIGLRGPFLDEKYTSMEAQFSSKKRPPSPNRSVQREHRSPKHSVGHEW